MSDWLKRLRYGIAEQTALDSDGIVGFDPAGFETTAPGVEFEIVPGAVPIVGFVLPEAPDEAIALSLYPVSESPVTVMGVQFRYRAASDGRLDLIEDALSNCWTDRWGGTLGGIRLVSATWASGASLGQDQNERLERSVNYRMTVDRPLTHRTT